MTAAQEIAARRVCMWAGVVAPPKLLLKALAAIPAGRKREFLESLSREQIRRMRIRETPAGRLGLMIEDMADEERRGLHRERMIGLAQGEM